MENNAPAYWSANNSDDDDEINISMISRPENLTTTNVASNMANLRITPGSSSSPTSRGRKTSSANMQRPRILSQPSAAVDLNLLFGEKLQSNTAFAPFKLVTQYPYLYVGKANHERVAEFFSKNLQDGYEWDFFALPYPGTTARDPLRLVPTFQFERFLEMANSELGTQLTIPGSKGGKQFSVRFGENGSPRPCFIKHTNCSDDFDGLKELSFRLPLEDLRRLSPAQNEMFCRKMDDVYNSSKMSKRKDPEAAKKNRMQRQKDCSRMLKRVQRYLGLRQALSIVSSDGGGPVTENGWDVSKPAPFKYGERVRFVCVDFEAYEQAVNLVTEIGLSILDTVDIANVPPGENGKIWMSRVQNHHFIISERSYMVNSKYVKGCPDAFNFGKSQKVSIDDASKVVGKLMGDDESEAKIPVVIVGHDIQNDLDYLMKIGYNPWKATHIIDEVDTKSMFQRMQRSPNGRGLGMICSELGIDGRNYHNAGNDAAYTMQAMIAMAVKGKAEGLAKFKGLDKGAEKPTPDEDEWTDGEMDDGGSAKRSEQPAKKPRAF